MLFKKLNLITSIIVYKFDDMMSSVNSTKGTSKKILDPFLSKDYSFCFVIGCLDISNIHTYIVYGIYGYRARKPLQFLLTNLGINKLRNVKGSVR